MRPADYQLRSAFATQSKLLMEQAVMRGCLITRRVASMKEIESYPNLFLTI
jgi:hypothetical protein